MQPNNKAQSNIYQEFRRYVKAAAVKRGVTLLLLLLLSVVMT